MVNNQEIFKAVEITSRPSLAYLISEILDLKPKKGVDQEDKLSIQNLLFKQLSFTAYGWSQRNETYDFELKSQIKQAAEKLKVYEAVIKVDPSWQSKQTYSKFKKAIAFSSIQELETKIFQKIGVQFRFDDILTKEFDNQTEVLQKILNFYNFIVASGILKIEQITQILFSISFTKNMGPQTVGYTSGYYLDLRTWFSKIPPSALIGMSFSKNWHDLRAKKSNFQDGKSTADDLIYTFVHEFGHAINYFYGLNQRFRKILNCDVELPISQNSDAYEKIKFHFQKKYGKPPQEIKDNAVTEYAVNSIVKQLDPAIKKSNNNIFTLAKWVSVPSAYAWRPSENEQAHPDNEWFAEGFAYYCLTKPQEQNKIWEFWHNLLTKELPKKFG